MMTTRLRGLACRLNGAALIAAALQAAIVLPALTPVAAMAHAVGPQNAQDTPFRWTFSPEIIVVTLLAGAIYLRGMARRATVRNPVSPLRHAMFLGGVGAIYLALQSPLDQLAEHLFWLHQVQHFMLRMLGPMLIALAAPESVLIAGLPAGLRRGIVAPVLASGPLRGFFGLLSRPLTAFVLFVASLYVWQVPTIHDAALASTPVHYLMHVTMLAAGLLFFWVVLGHNDRPATASHGARILMLIGAILSSIVIGALTTMKMTILYTGYGVGDRLFGISPMADETTGGIILWVPSSMMYIIAIMIVLHGRERNEDRSYRRNREREATSGAAVPEIPRTAADLRGNVRSSNRGIALTLFAVYLTVLVGAVVGVVAYRVMTG